ncbi:PAS domain-containing protein, partial [Actinomadura sp. DSM 109109]|nr:PAS domain-containing protein [Actinomadura lepetitiana]
LAICTLHFIGMGAVSIFPDSSIAISEYTIAPTSQAVAAAAATLVILVLAASALWIDLRFRRQKLEVERMHGLANAAVEGLIVCDGDRVVSANDSMGKLTGMPAAALGGTELGDLFDERVASDVASFEGQPREAELRNRNGTRIPVE